MAPGAGARRVNLSPIGYLVVPAGGTLKCPRCTLWISSLGSEMMARVRWYSKRVKLVPSSCAMTCRCARCDTTLEVEVTWIRPITRASA